MGDTKWKKRAGMFFLAAMIAIAPPLRTAAKSLKEAKQEKEQLEDALKEAQTLIENLKGSKEDIRGKVVELDSRLTQMATDITNLEAQLATKNTEISDTREVLQQAEEDERIQFENMKLRIRYMYEKGQSSYLEQLLSVDSFADFLNAVEYIRQISSYDRNMLEKYQQAQETVSSTKSVLEEEQAQLQQMKDQVQKEKEAVQVMLTAKETELASVSVELDEASGQADAYAAEIEAQNAIIAQIQQVEAAKKAAEEKAKAEAEAAAKAAEEKNTEATETTESTESTETTVPGADAYSGGAFAWPCPSSTRVTSDYGNRISPTEGASSNHKGIDIGADYGADIVASADGTVVFAGYSSGAGNYIMIDHGGSLYTVYMHASSLCAEKGAVVTKGQVIAKVGSTGISTGNHLHFGVSLNGSYVSPWNYLSR